MTNSPTSMTTAADPIVQGKQSVAEVTIAPTRPFWDAVAELWTFRELFLFLALRDVKIKYRQALLGIAWAVLQPLATMAIFAWLFGRMMGVSHAGQPATVFYLSSVVPWLFFSAAVSGASNSLVGNADMLRKVYFPRLVLPGAATLACLVELGIGLTVLLVAQASYGLLSWRLLLWVPLVALLFTLALAVGALLAAINVQYRDVKHAVPFVMQLWLFLSPVAYPATAVPAGARDFLWLNPIAPILTAFRATAGPTLPIDWLDLSRAAGMIILITIGASYFFIRAESSLADVV